VVLRELRPWEKRTQYQAAQCGHSGRACLPVDSPDRFAGDDRPGGRGVLERIVQGVAMWPNA
jgi:hypothetical protein